MKTIGLIGGMSWESTLSYYRIINEGVKAALGGLHSATIVLYSVDFDSIQQLQKAGDWAAATQALADAARKVEAAGADCLLICTNTMHRVADELQGAIGIPLLHIADATAEVIVQANMKSVALLGTAFTMEQDFYRGRLAQRFGIEVLIPEADDRRVVHRIIYEELCVGKFLPESKQAYLRIIQSLGDQGAEAVILGCTEIGLLITQADTTIELLDTTRIHADQAVRLALS
ncbi:aspartate/glutamate racemase family protein [Mangrovimicrobium sediminis]|uniref:Aspartate/glutamate racemase family protein n=1 Tax=Mangrovimicrobium sediminis TaxID=2562682 RepID=A0A4Z0M604_9GAMM|nr:aspartate/glutamate racemase family protein [Haliea sp. SAOS-164]TGD74735.1 aspartate/glutamate racemase family protein [Haliea sp. SAOS-164]